MALVRRLPYRTHLGFEHQLRDMQRLMNALASQSSERSSSSGDEEGSDGFHPAVDVYRDGDNLVLDFELPGVDIDEDVNVEIHDGVLRVSGQRSSEREEERDGSYLRERRVGRFSRSLSLPDGVDPDAVEANYADGVLKICVPLPEDGGRDEPRRVEIGRDEKSATAKAVTTGDDTDGDTDRAEDTEKAKVTNSSKSTKSTKSAKSTKAAKATKSTKAGRPQKKDE